ncbi:MAG: hypothetical protein V1652_00010 [bacterium]
MKDLSQLPQNILDLFESDDVIGTIALANDSLNVAETERFIIPRALRDIETGILHPNNLQERLRENFPNVQDDKITEIVDYLNKKIIQPVLNDLATIHEYEIDSTIPTEKIINTSEAEPLKDPLDPNNTLRVPFTEQNSEGGKPSPIENISEESQNTPTESVFQVDTVPQETDTISERIEKNLTPSEPFILKDPLETPSEHATVPTIELPTVENIISNPPAPLPPIMDIDTSQKEPVSSKKPRLFKNLASIFSSRNKNPLIEEQTTEPSLNEAAGNESVEYVNYNSAEVVPNKIVESIGDKFTGSTSGESSESTRDEFTEPTDFILSESGQETIDTTPLDTVDTLPPKPFIENESMAISSEQPTMIANEKTAEDILMGDTINLSETNPEIETPTIITVSATQRERSVYSEVPAQISKEQNIYPTKLIKDDNLENYTHSEPKEKKPPEILMPSFIKNTGEEKIQQARPFILHEEKEDEQMAQPSFTSYDTIKPSFYRPSFAETTPVPTRPVSARLEFGDDQTPESTPVTPTTTEKSKPRVIHYSSLKTENPFGNQFENNESTTPQQQIHPNNIVDLRENNQTLEATSDIHPNNIVNLKDIPK